MKKDSETGTVPFMVMLYLFRICHQCILYIGVSTLLNSPSPFFSPSPLLNLQTVKSPPFRQSSPKYWFFGIFQWTSYPQILVYFYAKTSAPWKRLLPHSQKTPCKNWGPVKPPSVFECVLYFCCIFLFLLAFTKKFTDIISFLMIS